MLKLLVHPFCLFIVVAVLVLQCGGTSEDLVRIVDTALSSDKGWAKLQHMCNSFGQRVCGSPGLEHAIEWCMSEMETEGLDRVRREGAMVPHWIRGEESAALVQPYSRKLPILGFGGSVGTDGSEIVAEVLVVSSFDDLQSRSTEAKGRIVVFNVPFTTYGETVVYRSKGAIEAAKVGGLAALVRSVTPFSMQSPHTGGMGYDDVVPKIPSAGLTIEDAELLDYLCNVAHRTVIISLKMEAKTEPDVQSYNVLGEVTGWQYPQEVVVIGGHIDSWDVGQGAMDDGGGCIISWEAVRIMKELGIQPRRTVRAVLFVNEEHGASGGKAYAAKANRTLDTVLAIESDAGVFAPTGIGFSGSSEALAIMETLGGKIRKAMNHTIPLDITKGGGGVDIGPLMQGGVPGAGLHVVSDKYFWYHHSDADTMAVIDKDEMNQCTAVLAAMAYLVADLEHPLPRGS